jgi:hypothetical protein
MTGQMSLACGHHPSGKQVAVSEEEREIRGQTKPERSITMKQGVFAIAPLAALTFC